ncbi:Lon, substrate-binding domain containing protein [Rhabdaerophilaceae bacterium]
MPSNVSYSSPDELPGTLALFPLPGALLLPRSQIPLNIFEPRYIAMIDAALAGSRLVGMIQPDPAQSDLIGQGRLFPVGCAGRITQIAESGDGRYLLQLTGICRFRIKSELAALTPYRQAQVDFAAFANDLLPGDGEDGVNRDGLLKALRDFSQANRVEIDWDNIRQAPNEALVNALSMMSPYGVREKQALLEAVDLKARADMLIAITEIELARSEGDDEPRLQ